MVDKNIAGNRNFELEIKIPAQKNVCTSLILIYWSPSSQLVYPIGLLVVSWYTPPISGLKYVDPYFDLGPLVS